MGQNFKSSGIRVKRAHAPKKSSLNPDRPLSAEECAAGVVENLSPTDMPGTLWDTFRSGQKANATEDQENRVGPNYLDT